MSQESSGESSQSWYRHFHPPPPPPPEVARSRSAQLPPIRYPRDGFDFRRPAGTPNQEDHIIDLTNEPETPPQPTHSHITDPQSSYSARAPRFGRPILTQDVVDLEELDDPVEGLSSSPEVQFVSASIRQQPLPRPRPMHDTRFQTAFFEASRGRHPPSRTRPFPQGMSLPSMLATFRPPMGTRGMPQDIETLFLGHDALGQSPIDEGLVFDYGLAAFDMEQPAERPEDTRRETYKALSPPPEGFTRTLGDEDVAICPNCECELGIGEGKKQEIWVAKTCGHVYCGECAENRSKSKSRKINTSQKTKPFSKCQVDACGKQVSAPTAMFHLYL
ncbi:hypothetical protein N7478_005006 [Penicillium angulare]|uniref:uncharacterized protein n=1 Tax=Penicillium angulare TaxID=116970 RepID=UPI002540BBEF|nr:uncharacterized protein N7478_005006 [Penicillium angulare]KAJ5279634.1 hypothetical protein N7478_005006 [Penicillium angulare]